MPVPGDFLRSGLRGKAVDNAVTCPENCQIPIPIVMTEPKPAKKRRIWKVLLLLAIVLPLAAAGIAQWLVSSRITPEFLVSRIEKGRNCRADLEACTVRLFSFPATVELKGLRIVPADADSLANRPPASRKPAKPGDTVIAVSRASLSVSLWSLLRREIHVKSIVLDQPEVRMIRKKNGTNTLTAMLGPRPKDPKKPETTDDAKPAADAGAGGRRLDLREFDSLLESAVIRGGVVAIRNEKRKQMIRFEEIAAETGGLTIPAAAGSDGTATGKGRARLTARLVMDNLESGRTQLNFPLTVSGDAIGFHPASGVPADDTSFVLTVARDAYIDRIPTLEKLGRKFAKLKDRIGLDLTSMPVHGTLEKETTVTMSVSDGSLRFTDDVTFPFDTYRIRIRKDGWLRLSDGWHAWDGIFTANEEITKNALAGIDEFLASHDESLARIARETIIDCLLNDKGRLALPYISTEEIGRPEVELSRSFERKLASAMVDVGKHLLIDGLQGGDGIRGLLKAIDAVRN